MPQRSRAQRLNGLFPLSYTGVVPVSPVNFVMDDRPPTINDSKNFYIGDLWLDTSTQPPAAENLWMLVSLVGYNATWVNFASGAAAVETLTGNSGGAVSVDANDNINVVGTGVITVVGNPGTNTLTVTPSGSIASSFITNPVTGTATPVAGVLTFAGTGGIAVSAAGSTVTIAASGTPAPMVGFAAYKSVDTPNATGDGTFYNVICNAVRYDYSSNYNSATGVFTAPTTGSYHFDSYIACNNITTQNLGSIFMVTTTATFETNLQSPVNDKQGDNILHYQFSVDTLMNAGDTAYLQISLSGAAKTVGITGAIPPGSPIATYFNGHRLDPAASFITGAETFVTDAGTATPDINGVVNVLAQNSTLGAGSSVVISAPGSSNTIQLNLTDTNSNTILGKGSGSTTLTGTNNTVLGQGSFSAVGAGAASSNIIIGKSAGNNLTGSESRNILINDLGVTGLSNFFAIHIPGTAGNGFDMHNFPGANAANGSNVFIGQNCGNRTMTVNATSNYCIGESTLAALTTGPHNVALGNACGTLITTGDGNVLLGHQTGFNLLGGTGITTGDRNIAIGYSAGTDLTGSDSRNILIGEGAGNTGDNLTIRIGGKAGVNPVQTRCFIEGIRGRTTGVADAVAVLIDSAGQLGTVSSSIRYKENVETMGDESSGLMQLRPVTFAWKKDDTHKQNFGLIAEEVEEVLPELVVYDKEGQPETVKYHDLPVLILNELLKLADRVRELEERIEELENF